MTWPRTENRRSLRGTSQARLLCRAGRSVAPAGPRRHERTAHRVGGIGRGVRRRDPGRNRHGCAQPRRSGALRWRDGEISVRIYTPFGTARDEGEAYARRLKSAGVAVTLVRLQGHIHGSMALTKLMPSARDHRELVHASLRERVSPFRAGTVVRCELVTSDVELRHIEIHGHRVGYRTRRFRPGDRPRPRHGRELGDLAVRHAHARRALHGRRARPRRPRRVREAARRLLARRVRERRARSPAGAWATSARRLVGQSLGGGVAMQFAYQFPERMRTAGARVERRAWATKSTCCCACSRCPAPSSCFRWRAPTGCTTPE